MKLIRINKIIMKASKKMQKFRVREELKIKILKVIDDFKSEAEPDYKKLTEDDLVNVLSSLIERRTSIK